jgi:hypothetical protein
LILVATLPVILLTYQRGKDYKMAGNQSVGSPRLTEQAGIIKAVIKHNQRQDKEKRNTKKSF